MVVKSGRAKKKASARKVVRKRATPRARTAVARVKRVTRGARRESGSIAEAAVRVVKSGAILVGHTGQRMVASAARKVGLKVHNMLHSAADATSAPPRPTAKRRARR